jgi:hypothetical protein
MLGGSNSATLPALRVSHYPTPIPLSFRPVSSKEPGPVAPPVSGTISASEPVDDNILDADDTMGGKAPKPFDRRAWRKSVTKGPLREEIDQACEDTGMTLKQLTVLGDDNDAYRFDTRAGHREGQCFADQVERLVAAGKQIHLRGLHYQIFAWRHRTSQLPPLCQRRQNLAVARQRSRQCSALAALRAL